MYYCRATFLGNTNFHRFQGFSAYPENLFLRLFESPKMLIGLLGHTSHLREKSSFHETLKIWYVLCAVLLDLFVDKYYN